MSEKIVRMPIPPVVYLAPECPLCDESLSFEEGWVCEKCEVSWPERFDDSPGVVDDSLDNEEGVWEPRPQCEEEISPFDAEKHPTIGSYRYRCVRHAGHDLDMPLLPYGKGRRVYHVGIRIDSGTPNVTSMHDWTIVVGVTE